MRIDVKTGHVDADLVGLRDGRTVIGEIPSRDACQMGGSQSCCGDGDLGVAKADSIFHFELFRRELTGR